MSAILEIVFQSRTTATICALYTAFLLFGPSFPSALFSEPLSKASVVFILAGMAILASALIRLTRIGKYHGAEHMAEKAYSRGLPLTVENVMKEDRVHEYCGTNLAVFFLSFSAAFVLLGVPLWISLLAGWLLGYEVFLTENKRVRKLMAPIYWLGGTAQRYLFTSQPTDREIEVAISSLMELDKHDVHLDQ